MAKKIKCLLIYCGIVLSAAVFSGQVNAEEAACSGLAACKDKNLLLDKKIQQLKKEVIKSKKNAAVYKDILDLSANNLRGNLTVNADEKNMDKIIHTNLGFAYAMKGKNKSAIREYKKALKSAPGNKDIHFNLGCLFAREKIFREAVAEYNNVLKIFPRDKEAYYNLAIIYMHYLKDTSAAEACFEKFVELKE